MRSKLIGLLAALFLVCGCARKIITTDQIEDIEAELERADKDTLVVFDCDDVLITGPAHTKVLVSEKMPKLVDNLQQRGVQTVILTAYSINASKKNQKRIERRTNVLKSLGYRFEKFSPALASCRLRTPNKQINSEYTQGIIWCNGVRKDYCLNAFLEYSDYHPEKIIFIDDRIENIQIIEAYCKKCNIDYVGIEYTAVANKKRSVGK